MRRKIPIERGGPTVYLSSKNLILCSAKSQMTKEFAFVYLNRSCLDLYRFTVGVIFVRIIKERFR
jgi:hypothetical protein